MIFTEFLSKPAIHFAEVQFECTLDGYVLSLKSRSVGDASSGRIESGYRSRVDLNAFNTLARNCVRRATIEPSSLKYNRGPVRIDSATDLVCFVPPPPPPRDPVLPTIVSKPLFGTRANYRVNTMTTGNVRHAGIQFAQGMLQQHFRRWFDPGLCDLRVGPYVVRSIAMLMALSERFEKFYIVLTDVSENGWSEYYKNFPIAFHDYTGSYAEVQEVPVLASVLDSLWSRHPSRLLYLRTRGTPEFGKQIDLYLNDQQRVKILLGFLESARHLALASDLDDIKGHIEGLKIGIFARKPDIVGRTAPQNTQSPPTQTSGDVYMADDFNKRIKHQLLYEIFQFPRPV
ncbi:hypothetical protein GE09DRAFT_1163174 [Coniochaeta sp. 2T2.1]|nr:hypothetical protein GE09DRAFT_1163174 [Coniochaeta sp. 2T2.1]